MTFAAELGPREKVATAIVAAILALVVVVIVSRFGASLLDPALALPFVVVAGAFVIALGYRPLGYTLGAGALAVERPFGAWTLPYDEIRAVSAPASYPTSFNIGLWRVEGLLGTYGLSWNRPWGVFRVFVTDSQRLVEIVREDGSRVILSPSDPRGFRDALMAAARRSGAEIAFAT